MRRPVLSARDDRIAWFFQLVLLLTLIHCSGCRPKPNLQASPSASIVTPKEISHQLSEDTTWTFQLQSIDLEALKSSPSRLLVIDPSRGGDGDSAGFWTKEEIQSLRSSGKTILAYISVGEAETYRDYWLHEWSQKPPDFLVRPNLADGYPDNYLVKYWDVQWRKLVLARIQLVLSLGFDGVYLDKVDAFDDWLTVENHPEPSFLEDEMAALIMAIESEGKGVLSSPRRPFQLYIQNAWKLWTRPDLASVVDGVGIEEFSLGWEGVDGRITPPEIKRKIEEALRKRSSEWKVLVVDYPAKNTSPETKQRAEEEGRRVGALTTQAPRELDGEMQ